MKTDIKTQSQKSHLLIIMSTITLGIITIGTLVFLFSDGRSSVKYTPIILSGSTEMTGNRVETDTGKRLETLVNSGTNWGMSPFGSGKPLTEEEKPEFKKPNTEWKTRTISGVTYVFGEGNPREVALPESEMIPCNRQDDAPCTDNGAGYVDPLLEKLVYDVLSSPDWGPLILNCEKDFKLTDDASRGTEGVGITYERLLNIGSDISLEKIFTINPKTGRKNITIEGYGKLMIIHQYLESSTHSNATMGTDYPTLYTKCVDTYGVRIINTLANIRSLPWRGSKDTPENQGGWSEKNLIPIDQPLNF